MNANEVTERQQAFLNDVGLKIIRLLEAAKQGSRIAYFRLGTKMIDNKLVVLKLVVEDVPDYQAPIQQGEE